MTERRTRALSGLVKEGFVIFAGVLFALAADDWRQSRVEMAEAESSLRLILQDLVRDSGAYAEAVLDFGAHDRAAAWLFAHWDDPAPNPDSLQRYLISFGSAALPTLNRAGYDGLRTSNQLDLLGSEELRRGLTWYYEVLQPDAREYSEITYARREELLAALAPYVRYLTYPPDRAAIELRGGWSALTADPRVHFLLRHYGGSAGYIANFAQVGLLPRVEERIAEVEEYLGEG